MKRMICLGMGVCCDYVGGFLKYHELSPDLAKEIHHLETIHSSENLPVEFYESLSATPDFPEIFELIRDRFVIASYKIKNRRQAIGQYLWFLKNFESIALMPGFDLKSKYFTDEGILIDDDETEINAWTGPTILVPRPWNSATGDPVAVIRQGLALIEASDIPVGEVA